MPHEDRYMAVHGIIIHTIPKLEDNLNIHHPVNAFFKNAIYSYSELQLNNEKKKLLIHAST